MAPGDLDGPEAGQLQRHVHEAYPPVRGPHGRENETAGAAHDRGEGVRDAQGRDRAADDREPSRGNTASQSVQHLLFSWRGGVGKAPESRIVRNKPDRSHHRVYVP